MRERDQRKVDALVAEAMEHGSLIRPGCPKTVTIAGQRCRRIRIACVIFAVQQGHGHLADHRDRWLVPLVEAGLHEWRQQ